MGETIEIQAADGDRRGLPDRQPGRPGRAVLHRRDRAAAADRGDGRPDRVVGVRRARAQRLLPRRQRRRARAAQRPAGARAPARRSSRAAWWTACRATRRTGPCRTRTRGSRTLLEHAGDGPVGVTGYCMGARLAVRTAGSSPAPWRRWAASTAAAWSPTPTDSPHLAIADSTAEYVFGHADNDRGDDARTTSPSSRRRCRPPAARTSTRSTRAPPHGYSMADTSMYQEAGAERHFKELEGLLAQDAAVAGSVAAVSRSAAARRPAR